MNTKQFQYKIVKQEEMVYKWAIYKGNEYISCAQTKKMAEAMIRQMIRNEQDQIFDKLLRQVLANG